MIALGALVLVAARPTVGDLMGLNTHTIQFRPDLYRPIARRIRNYHPFDWDIGDDTSRATTFPMAANGVDWASLYGRWAKDGYTVVSSVMFDGVLPDKWKDLPTDAARYGEAFARAFGPSTTNWVEAIEIGNEPGKWSDLDYRRLLEHAGRGIRRGDPRLKIATCAVFAKPSGDYHKNVEVMRGLEKYVDVINVHSYAQSEEWPTWRRSYPEDPKIPFLKDIQAVIDWRDRHAKGKQIWLTEFGWDSSTKKADDPWVGNTDLQQAQYIVRAGLTFSAMDLDRAYLFWFNDEDAPKLHGSSGLTRNYTPKPSFHAVAQFHRLLGTARFERVLAKREGDVHAFLYRRSDGKRVVAVWSPTGSGRTADATLKLPGKVASAETMALTSEPPAALRWRTAPGGLTVPITESVSYLILG